ncbi:MAG: signal peptide peptidase SppA [Armatimonadetes bacterium]|nr:signal peptide peptidase SppA [Armatimonadota bacterium]
MTAEQPPQAPPPPPPPPVYRAPMTMPPPRQRSSAWRWGCGFAIAALLLLMMLGGFLLLALMDVSGVMEDIAPSKGRIVVIHIDGMIVAGQSGFSMLGGAATGSDDIVHEIERAAADRDVKGILLRINSPGGSAAGSQEIYDAVRRARESRNGEFVVVASMADVAASGGYYVAAGANAIFADSATMTGSIGAIAMHEDMSGLFEKIGIKPEVIKSGELKDMLNPMSPMSDEARQIVQTLVQEVRDQFVQAVADGRDNLDRAAVEALADGRVYTGQQAVENGLVDEIGGLREALDQAGELTGLGPSPATKEYGEPSLLRWLLSSSGTLAGRQPVAQPHVAATGGMLYDDLAARLVGQASGAVSSLEAAGVSQPKPPAGDM